MVGQLLREFYEVVFSRAAGYSKVLCEPLFIVLNCYKHELPRDVVESIGPWETNALHVIGARYDITDPCFEFQSRHPYRRLDSELQVLFI